MRRNRGLQALALIGLLTAAPAYAEWSVNVQIERFRWNEQITAPEVNETGGRAGVGWSWQLDQETGFRWRYRGALYAGSLKYKGQTLGIGTPAQGTADYAGFVNEVHGLYRSSSDAWLQVVGGLGFDYWQRTFPFTSQREDWSVWFTRIGVESGTWRKRGLFAGVGAKYPLYTNENAHLTDAGFDQNPELRPGRELSAYAELGYRLSSRWKFTGYYDSYRFAQSPVVNVTSGSSGFIVFQPRSSQDVVGLRIDYYF